jgi:hypothetical protein
VKQEHVVIFVADGLDTDERPVKLAQPKAHFDFRVSAPLRLFHQGAVATLPDEWRASTTRPS